MGFAQWLGLADAPPATVEASVAHVDPGMQRGLLTLAGYDSTQLPTVITRETALRVPALLNGVKVLCGIAHQLPLVCNPSQEPREFLNELDPMTTRGWTVAKTVEDLIFYNLAWWYVTRRNARGFPRNVQRVDPLRVEIDREDGSPKIDGQPVDSNDLKQFPGIVEGVLVAGVDALGTALANTRQARIYAEHPAPQRIYTDADGAEPMDTADARQYMTDANTASRNHGDAYMAGMKVDQVGWNANEIQLLEARQHDAVEAARVLAMPPRYVAAPTQGDSLTYSNLTEVRRDLIDIGGLANYLSPIEQRLSMPDMTPAGSTVKFDAESYFLRITPDQESQPAESPASQPTESAVTT